MKRLVPLFLLVTVAYSEAKKPMSECSKTIGPSGEHEGVSQSLSEVIDALPEGGILCLQPGTYGVNAVIKKTITLRGLGAPGDVILDGFGRTSVLRIAGKESQSVTIERLTIRNGANREGGGGVQSSTSGQLVLRDVVLQSNLGDEHGGAALGVIKGHTTLERCRVVDNLGSSGAAIFVEYAGHLLISESLIAGNRARSSVVRVGDGGELTLVHVTIAGNRGDGAHELAALELAGSGIGSPTVTITDSIISGAVAVMNSAEPSGQVTIKRSLVDGSYRGKVIDGGGNKTSAPVFDSGGAEPYRPAANSPALGIAQPGSGTDLSGAPSGSSAGALQPRSH